MFGSVFNGEWRHATAWATNSGRACFNGSVQCIKHTYTDFDLKCKKHIVSKLIEKDQYFVELLLAVN